jgi:uncharacterized CHY-type Zn-finger protein
MYNCEICGKNINERDFEVLDMKAGDSDQIVCVTCVKKFVTETHVKVIAKVGKAALVMICWEKEEVIGDVSEVKGAVEQP